MMTLNNKSTTQPENAMPTTVDAGVSRTPQPPVTPRPSRTPAAGSASGFLHDNWITILVLLYLVSPVDLVPEAILPVIGMGDDTIVAVLELVRRWREYRQVH